MFNYTFILQQIPAQHLGLPFHYQLHHIALIINTYRGQFSFLTSNHMDCLVLLKQHCHVRGKKTFPNFCAHACTMSPWLYEHIRYRLFLVLFTVLGYR